MAHRVRPESKRSKQTNFHSSAFETNVHVCTQWGIQTAENSTESAAEKTDVLRFNTDGRWPPVSDSTRVHPSVRDIEPHRPIGYVLVSEIQRPFRAFGALLGARCHRHRDYPCCSVYVSLRPASVFFGKLSQTDENGHDRRCAMTRMFADNFEGWVSKRERKLTTASIIQFSRYRRTLGWAKQKI